jgi:hypothetical protein
LLVDVLADLVGAGHLFLVGGGDVLDVVGVGLDVLDERLDLAGLSL